MISNDAQIEHERRVRTDPEYRRAQMAGYLEVVLLDHAYVSQMGDVHIENPTPPEGVWGIDPQHGGHRPGPGWPEIASGDAACTYAARLADAMRTAAPVDQIRRIVLLPWAGVDDYAAAAVLGSPTDERYVAGREARLRALADADNGLIQAGAADWRPGYQHIVTLGDRPEFGGLGRIAVCREISASRKVEIYGEWLRTGKLGLFSMSATEREVVGVGQAWLAEQDLDAPLDLLAALNELAASERGANLAACEVDVSWEKAFVPQGAEGLFALATRWVQDHPIQETGREGYYDAAYRSAAEELCVEVGMFPLVTLVTSQLSGLSAGRGAFAAGYQFAPVVVAYSPVDRLYTIGRATNARQVVMFFVALVAALNEAEDSLVRPSCGAMMCECAICAAPYERPALWGGNASSLVLGSPKPGGSALRPAEVVKIVLQHVRWV